MASLYPAGPSQIPSDLTQAPPRYRNRAYLAVASLLAFVLVYVGLTGWFGYKGYTLLREAFAGGQHAFAGLAAGLVCAFLAVFLGKALLSIRRGSTKELVEVGQTEPQLVEFVHRVADDVGAPRPHKIFFGASVNAAVFYDVSLLNLLLPSRKNLIIGLGLVNVLSLSELKAVLGHEFGHFAQRSMAVGRYVYIGQQIAAHIIGKRDWLDRVLVGISNIDIRVAWIGWGMRIIVWSVRSVMDSLFRVVIVAERALSRQMELQADLVAVSITGSDALVHGLHKLRAADEAWDRACDIAGSELRQGRAVPDLYSMQTRVLQHLAETLGETEAAGVPPLPEHDRDKHRIFSAGLAQPPQMWSTHPPNHVREDNAKARYVEVYPTVATLVAIDKGEHEELSITYRHLARGELQDAVATAPTTDATVILRLAAASDGAPPELVERTLSMPAGDFDRSFLPLVALGRREGRDVSAYVEALEQTEQYEPVLAFLNREALLSDLDAASAKAAKLSAYQRGLAEMGGLILLGSEAPPQWRDDVERLLFSAERPWFAPAPTPDDAEPSDAEDEPGEGPEAGR